VNFAQQLGVSELPGEGYHAINQALRMKTAKSETSMQKAGEEKLVSSEERRVGRGEGLCC
jgi:hypothetical protein